MNDNEQELGRMLESTTLSADVSPARVHDVRQRTMQIAAAGGGRRGGLRLGGIAAAVLVGMTAVGVAGTETGREWMRSLFTRIEPAHKISGEREDGSLWSVTRSGPEAGPFSAEEAERTKTTMDEVAALMKAGEGRLVEIMEGQGIPGVPGAEVIHITCIIEYTLSNGEKTIMGQQPTPAQVAKMRLDEIMKLWDAGEGEIVSKAEFPLGLGRYVIRFTLGDGQTVVVRTLFPPGPRAEREAIFAEAKMLKQARRFTLDEPVTRTPDGRVTGTLRYNLADGRVVGVVEEVPADVISPDGKYVVTPLGEESAESAEIQDQDGQ